MTSYQLIICEKQSVATTIATVLDAKKCEDGFFIGKDTIVSWCAGHLLELAAPDVYDEKYAKWRYEDLPILPKCWRHLPLKKNTRQLKNLVALLNRTDVDCVVNACDAGREGELIFRIIYEYAGSRLPIKRLWISSMEDSAICAGFDTLKDGAEYDSLYAAALCRSKADWLAGINGTRLLSCLYGTTLTVGRVQSPTLSMLVKREKEIQKFVKEPFYTAELDLGEFSAISERFDDKTAAENTIKNCTKAIVTSVTKTEKSIAPPKLHDLTALQREANRLCGFTAQQTLEYAQSLYEKKLATYPRVDSRYLTDDMAKTAESIVHAIVPDAPCNTGLIVNSQKVSDHHAIIPTLQAAKADNSALPSGEREILQLLKRRMVCAVGEKHRYLETVVTLESGGTVFKTKGRVVLENGWREYDASADKDAKDDEDEVLETIPKIVEGQGFPVTAKLIEGFTSPPKRFTEGTLLLAMENAEEMPNGAERRGLGTPATRASIIEKLINSGFVERAKKSLIPTQKGINLIAVLPNALTSAKLTADWEQKLLDVQHGRLSADEFMANIAAFTKSIVVENNKPKPEFTSLFPDARKTAVPLGKCPRCAGDVTEGTKGFFCTNSRNCGFKLWKDSKFWTSKKKPLTAAIVTVLLKDGRVALKNLHSDKTGKKYDATVVLDDSGGHFVGYKMEFET